MNWGADVNDGQTEVIQRIRQILNALPRGIQQPFIVRCGLLVSTFFPLVLIPTLYVIFEERFPRTLDTLTHPDGKHSPS